MISGNAGLATASGWRSQASCSRPSAIRGEGREKYELASTAPAGAGRGKARRPASAATTSGTQWPAATGGFAGAARYGYAKSQHCYVYGVPLVLVSDRRGLPVGCTLVPANEKEYEPIADLLTGTEAGSSSVTRASGASPSARGSQAAAPRS